MTPVGAVRAMILVLHLAIPAGAAPGVVEVPYDEPLDDLAAELGPPGVAPSPAELEALTRTVSKKLRCPVCQGSSIQDSPVESAVNMRKRVQELLGRGYSEEQIQAYFVERYGEWILLAPRADGAGGLNWIVWLAPAAAGGLALAVVAAVAARWRREPEPTPLNPEGTAALDPYEERLLREIDS